MDPLPIEIPELTDREQAQLDALAETFNVELRADYNEDVGLWGIILWCPLEGETERDSDLAGTGETVYEAIDAARDQLQAWESRS